MIFVKMKMSSQDQYTGVYCIGMVLLKSTVYSRCILRTYLEVLHCLQDEFCFVNVI